VTDAEIVATMIRFGGGFVSALGALYRQADDDNRRRLKAAFPEYFRKYDALARDAAAREASQR
jgi:hypothetical protein